MFLHYNLYGLLIIRREDDPDLIVDAMLGTNYSEEFCIAYDFSADFIARLMKAGFLVMSVALSDKQYVLLPKLHLIRSVLFFENLHIKKSIKRYLGRFELRFNTDFDFILDRCIAIHGDEWLTPPLVAAIRDIRRDRQRGVYPVSFALYRGGKPVAGEFGIVTGSVYTSYSGYYDEDNAGTVQLILTTRFLREHGYAFFDLGMPLEYKAALGARNISPEAFVANFRGAANAGTLIPATR